MKSIKYAIGSPLIWGILLLSSFSFVQAQQGKHLIGNIAKVSDEKGGKPFFRIPTLRSEGGKLDVELAIKFEAFNFEGETVYLRRYIHPDYNADTMGLNSPIVRIHPGDRLTYTLHNELPPTGHHQMNYLFMLPKESRMELKRGWASSALKADMIALANTNGGPPFLRSHVSINDPVYMDSQHQDWKLYWNKAATGEKAHFLLSDRKNYMRDSQELKAFQIVPHTGDHNVPHDFNTTNLHVHGLHVSPYEDDIFRRVPPTFFSKYQYEIDSTHASGTFWYHPHVHGSTALQVASGMSGALIIEDKDLSAYPELEAASRYEHERIMIFNQIIYDRETGELPDFYTLNRVKGGNTRGTTINGVVKPVLTMKPGEVQRWRMIHSGFESTLSLAIDTTFEIYQIAIDGIMFRKPRKIKTIHMAPGNRMDILIKAPSKQKKPSPVYSIEFQPQCEYFPEERACDHPLITEGEGVLMNLSVEGKALNMSLPDSLPGPGSEHIDVDTTHHTRETIFNIKSGPEFLVNDKVFDANRIDEKPLLGSKETWMVQSDLGGHPYHIHVNPFQVWKFAGRRVDPPIWKDVVWVTKNPIKFDQLSQQDTFPQGSAEIRTHYQKYWGDFVLHCHILHHEDRGMMQRVRVVRTCEESDLKPEECEACKQD